MSRQIVPRRVSGVHRRAGQPLEDETTVVASALFDQYCAANTFAAITSTFQQMCDVLELMPSDHQTFYQSLKERLTSWKAQSLWAKLDKRAQQREYKKGRQCFNTRCLIIGGGPCGLRVAIEIALLGGKAVVVEKRDRFSRNNVLHLWPFLIHDLKALGAKKFFGKFCTGAVDHISIRTLQCILLKVALLLGVEIHAGVSFDELAEPPPDQGNEKIGWRAIVTPRDHPLSEYEFDVLVGADGKRNTLKGFKRKEFRGKLAIAITANFINRNTNAEACVEEISGVAFIFNQKFFKDLNEKTGIDLENIVYYKDETHYFVMTAKKHSLLHKGVLINDYMDTARLLSQNNVNQQALLSYACEAADVSTRQQLPHLDYAHNHYGQPDVAMFDFTSIYAAEHATRVIERNGYKLLMGLCGDSLIEPFWPTGSGCARGFLGALDLAATIKNWASARYTPLEVMAQRESVYQLLSQTTPENLSKNFGQYTMDPQTRYPNVNLNHFKPAQVVHQYDCTEPEFLDEIVQISDQKSKKYEWIRDSLYLQKWFGRQLESYGTIVKITDLEASWRNGLALCALIHKYRPELIGDIYKLDPNEVANNNQLAFDVAEKELGITPVMTGVDMAACEVPDKLTLVSYLSQFYEFFRKESIPTRPPVKIAKSPAQLPLPPRRIPQARSPAQRQTFLTRVNNRMRARKSAGADQLSSDLGLLYRQYQAWSSSEDILDRYAIPEEEQKENAERHLTQGHIRKRGHAEEDPDNIVLQGYSRFEGRHVNEPATKLTRQGDTARLSATPRTRNKVTQLARGLAHKLRGDPTVPQEKKKPLIIKQQIPSRSAVMGKAPPSADVCYFCQKRVYVVERHSAEGVFFHRGCLKCDFCSTNLRIGQYGFKRGDNGQAKFYCTQHIGLERPMRRSRKRSYDDKELRAQLAAVEDSDEDLPYGETVVVDEPHSMNEVKAAARGSVDLADERLDLSTERLDLSPERIVMSAVELAFKPESLDVLKATNGAVGGPLDKTPERIEYYTESEVEESELEQTQHNLSGSLLDIGVRGSASDSDEEILLTNQQLLTILGGSSSDELEWSDDAELSGAEGEWAQFATAYNKLNRLHKERRAARRAARLKQRTAGSGSDTETPGSSDDWESESETEKESEGEESDEDRFRSVRQDDGPPPVMPAQAREFSDEYEEEPRSPRSPLGQQLSPIDYEDKHPSPAATSILKNRLSFFSAVSEPVRIDPFSFLGLSPAPNIAQGEKQLEQESEQEPEQVPELKEAEAEKAEEELAEKVYKEGDEEEEEETESSLSETDTMTEGSESEEDKMGVVKKVHHPIPTISIEEVDMVELRSDDNEVGELPLDNDARVVCVTPQYEDSIRQDDGPPATEPEYRDFSDEFEEDECADLQQQPAGEADVTTPAQGSEESVQREATAVEIAEQEISVPSPVRVTTERVPEVEAEQFEEAESDTPAQAEQVHEDSQGDEAARTELVPQVAGSDGEVSVMRNDEALRKELDLMELEVEAMKRSVGDRIAELAKVTALEETEMPPPVEEEPLVGDPGMVLLTAQALENVPPVVEENLETFATSDIVPSDGQQVASEPLAVFVKDVCITESTTDSAIDSLIEMDVCATEPTIESATDFNILVGPCATEPTTESTADFTILAGVCTTESTTNPTSDSLILTDVCPTDSTTDSSILTGVCTSESTTDESVPSLTDVLSSVSDVARSEDLSATCPSFEAQFKELSAAIDESQNVGVMHVAEETNLMSETDSNSLVSADTIGSESRSNGSSAKRPTDLLTDSSDLSALKLKTALEKEMRRQNKIATKNSVHRTSSSELESFENIEALLKHRGEDQGTDIEADRLSSPLDEDTPKAELQMKAAPVAAMSSVVPSEDDLGPLSSVGPSERPSEDDLAAQGMAPIASIQEMFADMESTLDDLTPVLAEGANVESWVSAVLSESDHLETLQEPLTNAGTVAPGPAETGDNSSSSPTLTNNNSDEASDAALKSKQSIEDPRESSEISQTILEVKASTSLKPVSKEEVAVVGNAEKEDFLPTSVSADSLLPKHRPRPLRKDISLPSGNQTLNLKEQMLLERQQARKKEEKLKAKQATKKEPKVSVNRKEETKRKTPTMSLKESESRLTKSLRESESKLRRQLSAPEPQIAKILEDKKHEENEKRKQPIFIKPPKKKSFDIPQDVPIAMAAAAAARARLTGRPISHDVKSKKQREEEVTKRLKEEHMKAKQAKKAEMERQDEARKKQREEDARRKRLQDEQRERDMEDARKKNEIELRRMREQKRTSKPVQIEKLDSWKQADAIKRIDTLLENLRGQPQTKGDTLKNLQKRQSEEIGILAQKLMSVEYRPGFENEMTPEKVASPSEKLEPTTEVILSIERGGGDAYPEKVYNIDDKFITSRDRRKRIRNLSNQSDSSITNVTNTTISTPSGSVRSISSVSEIFTANSIGISPGDTGSLDLLATTSESLGENISLDGLLDQDKDQLEETKNLIRPKSAGNVEELKQAVRPKSAQAALSVSIVDTSKADDSSMHTAESSLSESRSTNTTADESRYFTPNVSGLEVLDTSETSSNKCIQPADATSNTSSDRKSVDSLDTERSNSPLSPGKVTDAKRKFFCELPQPVCIDPKKIFRDLRSPQGKGKTLKDSLDKKEKRTHERDDTVAKGKEWKSMDAGMSRKAGGLDLRKDWQSMDSSTTPLSPTAGVPKTNLVNGEAEANVFYTPVSIMKTKADEPPQHRPHTEPTAKKRMLPPTKEEQESKPSEVEKGRREAEREKARQDARQRAKMLSDEELGIEEKNQKKPVITRSDSQPEATMYATKDMQPQPSASRTQPKPLSPQVQKVEGGRVPQHDRVGSDSSSRSTNSHPSEASTFGSSDRHRAAFSDGISDHSENSPAQSRKLINEKTKSLDRDKTKRRTLDTPTLDEAKDKGSGKKEKRRSFLAMLLPKKDKSKDKSTNVKPPKEDKKLKKTPEAKKSVLRLRTKLKMPKAAEKEKEMNRSSTYADEFNPFFEDAYGMEEKQKLKEKLDHVAPAATLTPTASRVAPKATVEEFDTESEFGDDRISVHSFRAQMLTEEDRAKAVKKQQKAAVRRQREQELKRLRMAQEIQRQLEEVEIKQRQVEMRGIALERALRGEGPDASRNEADLMQEWFNVVHEKNMLVRYESELMVHARELELEDRHSRLEQQLRDRMSISETEMTPAQKEEEQRILEELLEVVEQRDSLVALLEEDRLRLREEEKKRKTEILNR